MTAHLKKKIEKNEKIYIYKKERKRNGNEMYDLFSGWRRCVINSSAPRRFQFRQKLKENRMKKYKEREINRERER